MAEELVSPTAAAAFASPMKPDLDLGIAEGEVPRGFANLEDKGGWVSVRVKRLGGSVPVRITREAMEDHFEAEKGEKSLAKAYLEHSNTINATVLELAPSGEVYSTENPMRLGTADFE